MLPCTPSSEAAQVMEDWLMEYRSKLAEAAGVGAGAPGDAEGAQPKRYCGGCFRRGIWYLACTAAWTRGHSEFFSSHD